MNTRDKSAQVPAEALRAAREAFSRGDLDSAISRFRQALREGYGPNDVHRDLGRAYLRRGWHAEAERCLRAAIGREPGDAKAYAGLAAALLAQGRLRECRRAYMRAGLLAVRGMLPAALRWKAIAPPQHGAQLSSAEIAARANAVERMLEQGIPSEEAVMSLEQVVAVSPDLVDCQLTLARAYSALGRINEAAASAEAALRFDPGSPVVLAAVSGTLQPWNAEHAERFARRALDIDPNLESAHVNLSAALWAQGRLEEAEKYCREALRLNPTELVTLLNLASILKDQGRVAAAQALYRQLDPASTGNARACVDTGKLILDCGGNVEEARRWFRRGQSLADDARAHFLEALLDLSCGRLAAGWDRYEARKHTADRRWHREYARFPEWDGTRLGDGHLLVYGEQGLGDEIMFASMLADARKRAPRITLLCDARLGTLFARSFPSVEVVAAALERRGERAAALTGIDCHIAAGSLGRLYRRRPEDFPRHRGYLVPDPERMARWRERLAGVGSGLKVGLSWRGGVQGTGRSRRSLTLDALTPLLNLPGACWISLQHAVDGDEIARYVADRGVQIVHFEGVTQDLDDLAALIASLDVVVSVCNTNVHLAGALGKPVLVMAPLVPEWRYGRGSERMLWYPSARVYRQARFGEWEPVVQRIAASVAARISENTERTDCGE